jgi:predicted transcriptional regulator
MVDAADGPPPFDDAFGGDIEQRIYGTVLQVREPETAAAIATHVDCDPKTARKYLEWFAELGIIRRYDGQPVTYVRNDAYFEWRRINRLTSEHSIEELRQKAARLTETIEDYRETYGADTPADVDALDATEDVQTVYQDLADWTTAIEERRRLERARRQAAGVTESISG